MVLLSPPLVMEARLRLLVIVPSSERLRYGRGRLLSRLLAGLRHSFRVTIAVDHAVHNGVMQVQRIAEAAAAEVVVTTGRSSREPPAELKAALSAVKAGIVLAVGHASPSGNKFLLKALDDRTPLAYLPLHQPFDPVNGTAHTNSAAVHREMLLRSDVVFCCSPWERRAVTEFSGGLPHTAVVDAGCDFRQFCPGRPDRMPIVLVAGDPQDERARLDRVTQAVEVASRCVPGLRMRLLGEASPQNLARCRAAIAGGVEWHGYAEEDDVRGALQEAALLIALSDAQPLGLGVVEALATATPVVVPDLPSLRSRFGGEYGIHFVPPHEPQRVAQTMIALLRSGAEIHRAMARQHAEYASRYDSKVMTRQVRTHLVAAWARRMRLSAGFLLGPALAQP